jgi:hypothetical protein
MQAKFSFQQRNSIVATILVQKGKGYAPSFFYSQQNFQKVNEISEKVSDNITFLGRNF